MIRRRFDWPGLTTDIVKFNNGCNFCQRMKKVNLFHISPVQSHEPKKINEIIAIDYFGPLPTARGNIKYIVVIVDLFSKYVQLTPLKFATAQTTISCVERWI